MPSAVAEAERDRTRERIAEVERDRLGESQIVRLSVVEAELKRSRLSLEKIIQENR